VGGLPAGYVLATKADRDPANGDFSGEQMRRSVAGSLERLGLDHLQLVYIHDPEHTTFEDIMSPGGALEVLQQFQREGVIGHLGISGGPIDMMIRYVETGAFAALETHNRYTLLNRSAEPLLVAAERHGVAVVNAAPYASGLLAKGPSSGARYAYREAPPRVVERAQRMAELCQAHGVPLAAAALQFSMRDPRITSTIVGVSKPERVAETLAWAAAELPDAALSELADLPAAMDDPEASRIYRPG
jgi:D-threo-aldose 1-dehydrogenase